MTENLYEENKRLKQELHDTRDDLSRQRDMVLYQIITWFCLGISLTITIIVPLVNTIKHLM